METEIENLKKEMEKRLSVDDRIKFMGCAAGDIIAILAKYLIKTAGYTTTARVLLREIRELGKEKARKVMEMFKIEDRSRYNASKILKIVALFLGLELKKENGTYVVKCPYGESVRKSNEPFICKICSEFNQGIVEEVLGPTFKFKRNKYLLEDGFCDFEVEKK